MLKGIFLHWNGVRNGLLAGASLAALVLIGSRRLLHFDAALLPYLFASIFAAMGVAYRYTVWLDRPPTRQLWNRNIEFLLSQDFFQHLLLTAQTFVNQILLQRFVVPRSRYRWTTHFLLAWGTVVAFAVTFPLTFGWLHFESAPGRDDLYRLSVFGFPTFVIFVPDGWIGFIFYNTLNIAAVMVVIGTVMAFTRRILHPASVPAQGFIEDMLPLLILFAVSITGLFLTYSSHLMGGQGFRVLSTLHAFTVVILLVYMPFGKLFHIFQRGAQMGAGVYIFQRKHGETAPCASCGKVFTSQMQKEDVKDVLKTLGFQYEKAPGGATVHDLCPLCRRRMFMWGQHERLGGKFDASEGA